MAATAGGVKAGVDRAGPGPHVGAMTTPRLFVDAPLSAGATVALTDAQARYLVSVLRLGSKSRVLAFNGRDGEWACALELPVQRKAGLACTTQTRVQALPPDLKLLFAPVKRTGTDLIAEKAAELGVRTLQPVLTRRTQSETVRSDRLRLVAIEAAEQTERLDVPDIRTAAPLAKVLEGWDGRPLLFADEAGDAAPIPDIAPALARDRIAFLTGPEGGFDPEERRMLRALPYVTPVSLGPRILRAETAVIAGLTLIQSHWGDWRA